MIINPYRFSGGGGGGGGVDDFDTNTLSLYTELGSVTSKSIADGALTMNGSQGVLVRTGQVVTDGEVGVVALGGVDGGFVFRAQDSLNYYLAAIYDNSGSSGTRNRAMVYRRLAGSFSTVIGSISIPAFIPGTPNKFHVLLSGQSIRLFHNDVEIGSATNASFASGLCGPRANTNVGSAGCVFDSFFWP